MQQVGMAIRKFTWELEQCTLDAGMTQENTKVHLVSALNQDTLSHLDDICHHTVRDGDKMAHLETIQDRLHQAPYHPDVGVSKVGQAELSWPGKEAGGAAFAVDRKPEGHPVH